MTERQRLQRARMLLADRLKQCSPALAWRNANPGSKASDKSAAEMCRRELVWLSRWLDEYPEGPMPATGAPVLAPGQQGNGMNNRALHCQGVGGKTCGRPLPPRARKYCAKCRKVARKMNKRGYSKSYYKRHREPLKEKAKNRYHLQKKERLAAEERKKKTEGRRFYAPAWAVER